MNIEEFLTKGTIIPNPNYKKPSKSNPAGSPKFMRSDNYNDAKDVSDRYAKHLTAYGYDLTHLNRGDEKWSDYGVHINLVNTEEELQKERAKNQSFLEQTGNAVIQAVGNEVVLGAALGTSNLIDAALNIFSKKGENDYTNTVSQYFEEKQDEMRQAFAIYQKNPNEAWQFNDFGWFANNATSIASSASMLIPSTILTKGLGLFGKINKIAKLTNKGLRLAAKTTKAITGSTNSTARLAKSIGLGAEIGANAFISRTMENYMEARGVYNDVKDETLRRIKELTLEEKEQMISRNPELYGKDDEEIANYIAGSSADTTFRNDYAMLFMDIMQFKAIGSLWKGMKNKTISNALKRENKNAINSILGKVSNNVATNVAKQTAKQETKHAIGSQFIKNRINDIKNIVKHPLTTIEALEIGEGFEEGYQGIQTEKGKEVAEMILNPEYSPRNIGSYITDSSIWEQAFWGSIGGIGFQKIGIGLGNLYKKAGNYYHYKKGDISKEEFNLNMTSDEKIRAIEIKNRNSRNNAFVERMQLLNDLKNPDKFKTDPITNKRIQEDGVDIHESLTPEEAEIKKAELVNSYITEMALDAVDAGNYNLLKEYVSSSEFDKYFKEAGLELTAKDKKFSDKVLAKADEVVNEYETNLYNILHSADIDSEYIAQIASRELTREQLKQEELFERNELLQQKINELNKNKDINTEEYKRNAVIKYVKNKFKELNAAEQEMYNAYNNKQITKQAKEAYEKEYNDRRKSLIEYLNNYKIFNEHDAALIQNLNKKLKDDDNSIISDIDNTINNLSIETESTTAIPISISELIDRQLPIEDSISYINTIKPKTQRDYQERVDDIARIRDNRIIQKYNNAAKRVENWILKQDNLQQAFNDLMSGHVESLKEDLDLLKIGHHSTDDFTNSIIATIKEEQHKRDKKAKEEKEVVIDGKKDSKEKADQVRADINDITEKAEKQLQEKEENSNTIINNTTESTINDNTNNNKTDDIESQLDKRTDSSSTGSETKSNIENSTNSEDNNPNIISAEALSLSDLQSFDEAAKKDAKKIADAFQLTVDDMAVGKASTVAFNIFRTNRSLFDNALGKDINGPEVRALIEEVAKQLEEEGVSSGFAEIAAKRGIKLALGTISRRLEKRNNSAAEQFKEFADSIATKQNMTGELAAITKSFTDEELNEVIDKLLKVYADYKKLSTPKNQKVIINIERLFHDIVFDENLNIDFETAKHILYNMKDYISNPLNTKYIFTAKRSLNALLKNPIEFFNAINEIRLEEHQLDNYMHISPSSQRTPEYNSIIAGLKEGDKIEIEYRPDRYGNNNSISLKVNDKEIGFVSTVTPNTTNTEYSIFISKYSGGIAYKVGKNENGYYSNTDELFDAIYDEDDELWDILNKQHRHNLNPANAAINNSEIKQLLNHPIIKKALYSGIIVLPKKWDTLTKKVVDKYVTDRQKAQFITHILEGVTFFNPYAQTNIEFKDSYKQWIESCFKNYENTHKIQTALNNNKKIYTKYAGNASTYGNKNTDVKAIIDEHEHGISEIGLTFDRNPVVGVVNVDGNTMLINEKTGETIVSSTPFAVGSMGMMIGGRGGTPILAMFTSANKLGAKIKNKLKIELTDILTGFQEGKYNYEEVDKKLSSLFNGPGINNPTIFQGYSVVHNGNALALYIGGQTNKCTLIINKFKKGSTETGTGIIYVPNGDREQAKSSISLNKSFINKIVNEISDNVVYNRTFFTLNNVKNDNTSNNPYMYKENGKFVIELGGEKTTYDSFGDFVLQENAFNTNQGRNEQGGYFDNTDKVNSLYIDVSVLEPSDGVSLPVKETTTIVDTIKTATTKKLNNTKELLEKATIPQEQIDFLVGKNDFGISLVPAEYGYDKSLSREFAVFRKGKIYFSAVGASYVNGSPFSLKRLLIHENLHAKFKEQNLFERQGLVEDLFDTYNAAIEAVEHIIQTANEDRAEYKNAVKVRKWFEDNKFNPTDYFTQFNNTKNTQYANMSEEERAQIFAEEWLVETLTQPLLMNFLNNTNYRGQEVIVENITNENKSIWQKIVDLLLKLFGKGKTNVQNNTIFAQQYLILSNVNENNNTNTENINNESIIEDSNQVQKQTTEESNVGEDITKIEEKENLVVEKIDEEFGVIDDEDTVENQMDDIESDIELYNEEELNAATSDALDYVIDYKNNDGNATAETLGITRITNMDDYLKMYSKQDQELISQMMDKGELKYACQ